MKRIRMPAISATIGPTAMPMNMEVSRYWDRDCATAPALLLVALGGVLHVAARFFDGLARLAESLVNFAPRLLGRTAGAFAIARRQQRDGGGEDGQCGALHGKATADSGRLRGDGLLAKAEEETPRRGGRGRLGSGLLDLRREHRGEFPGAQAWLEAQHEAPTVVDHHFVVLVHGVLPALDHRQYGKPPAAEVEGAGSLFASHSTVAMHTNLHDARLGVCSS